LAERKFDIFEAMAAIDRRDGAWFASQSEEARKEFAAPVFLRWISAINNPSLAGDVLLDTNAFVNMHMWDLDDAELTFRLAALCGTNRRQKHEWIPMPGRQRSNNKARDLVATYNPSANDAEIDLLMRLYNRESFSDFVDETATNDAKDILKAYDKHYGSSKSESKASSKEAKEPKPKAVRKKP